MIPPHVSRTSRAHLGLYPQAEVDLVNDRKREYERKQGWLKLEARLRGDFGAAGRAGAASGSAWNPTRSRHSNFRSMLSGYSKSRSSDRQTAAAPPASDRQLLHEGSVFEIRRGAPRRAGAGSLGQGDEVAGAGGRALTLNRGGRSPERRSKSPYRSPRRTEEEGIVRGTTLQVWLSSLLWWWFSCWHGRCCGYCCRRDAV